MKKFIVNYNSKNIIHSIELQAKDRKDAQQLAQAYKRRNGYLGKTTIHKVKDPDKLKKAIINGLRKKGISEEFLELNFIIATI